jgi:hypothetical protein
MVWLEAPHDSADQVLPDLTGVPLREALRMLSRIEVSARINGQGMVARQQPAPGTPLPLRGSCVLWCAPGTPHSVAPTGRGVDAAASGASAAAAAATRDTRLAWSGVAAAAATSER